MKPKQMGYPIRPVTLTGWLAGVACLALISSAVPAQTIVNDTFSDNDYNNDGVADLGTPAPGTAGNGALSVPWFSHTAVRSVVDDAVMRDANQLSVNGGQRIIGTLYSVGSFASLASASSISLGLPGSGTETAILSFDLRFTGTIGNGGAGIRFGLFNSQGNFLTGDANSTVSVTGSSTNHLGYWGAVATGTSLGGELNRDNPTDSILGGTGNTGLTETPIPSGTGSGINDALVHRLEFRITRTSAGNAVLTEIWKDGVFRFSAPDIAPNSSYLTFDEIGLLSNNGGAFVLDNVDLVLTGVPEPSAMALTALGLGVLLAGQRRRN